MDNVVLTLSGREFKNSEISLVKEIAEMYPRLTRAELIETICENMDMFTPEGRGKKYLCTKLLEKLEEDGVIKLKHRKSRKHKSSKDKNKGNGSTGFPPDRRFTLKGMVGEMTDLLDYVSP